MMSTVVMHYAMNVSTNRWAGARCPDRLDLPWIADTTPTDDEHRQMTAICNTCPIIIDCALFALDAKGGFFAGIWLPWDPPTTAALRENRRTARTALRQKVRA